MARALIGPSAEVCVRILWFMVGVVIGGGCAKQVDLTVFERAERIEWAELPRLPSPDAAAYAAADERPRDPLIAALVDGWRHDGSLAAAAAALALPMARGNGGLTRWELREAAWRGGWPFPVTEARAWRSYERMPPPRDLLAWLDALPKDVPMALVRARSDGEDVWLGLHGLETITLGSVPRLAALGSPLTLPAVEGATWLVADPSGATQGGPLDQGARVLLGRTGEWLVWLRRGEEELARFPIHVDTETPQQPILRLDSSPPIDDDDDVAALADTLLAAVRAAYGLPAWTPSALFDAAVARYVEDPRAGSRAVLSAVGYGEAEGIAWACDDVTVQGCIDQWLWDPRRRGQLLSRALDAYGLHARLDASGVHLTLLLVDARDTP